MRKSVVKQAIKSQILVGVDYITDLIKARVISKFTAKIVRWFYWKWITCMFDYQSAFSQITLIGL